MAEKLCELKKKGGGTNISFTLTHVESTNTKVLSLQNTQNGDLILIAAGVSPPESATITSTGINVISTAYGTKYSGYGMYDIIAMVIDNTKTITFNVNYMQAASIFKIS